MQRDGSGLATWSWGSWRPRLLNIRKLLPGALCVCVLWREQRVKKDSTSFKFLLKHMLVCFNKLLTETFPKQYWTFSGGVKTCDLPDLEVASARLSLTLSSWPAPPRCSSALLGRCSDITAAHASNWLQRVRSSAVAWGMEYFSIYLFIFQRRESGGGGDGGWAGRTHRCKTRQSTLQVK